MLSRKIKRLLIIPIIIIQISVYGQSLTPELVSSSGDSNVNSSIQSDWSIGELSIEAYSNKGDRLTQGFHQGDFKITTVTDVLGNMLICEVFPNPVAKSLSIKTELGNLKKLYFIINDINGKMILKCPITDVLQDVNVHGFIAGVYFLNVFSDQKKIKTFKIIKSD